MYDAHNRFIGALNFNNMIPVSEEYIKQINIKPSKNDSPKEKNYKELLNNQLDWCNDNFDSITKKANKLYKFVTQTPEKSRNLTRRCCNFKKLENVLLNYRASLKTPFEKKQLCTSSASSTSLGVRQHACGRFPCSCHTYLFFL